MATEAGLSGATLDDGHAQELACDAVAFEGHEQERKVGATADLKDADELAVVHGDDENLLGP